MMNNTLIRKLWAVLFLLLMGGAAFAVPAATHTGHAMSAVMSTPKKKSKPALPCPRRVMMRPVTLT